MKFSREERCKAAAAAATKTVWNIEVTDDRVSRVYDVNDINEVHLKFAGLHRTRADIRLRYFTISRV